MPHEWEYNALRRRSLSTPFVHVPSVDWAKVRCGEKREFRTHPNGSNLGWVGGLHSIELPFPAVAYTTLRNGVRQPGGRRLEELMLVTDAWQEPLRAITPESLDREGFADRREFKRYWIRRHPRGGWRGMTTVIVIGIAPLRSDELQDAKDRLFDHFFGLWTEPVPYQPDRPLEP